MPTPLDAWEYPKSTETAEESVQRSARNERRYRAAMRRVELYEELIQQCQLDTNRK